MERRNREAREWREVGGEVQDPEVFRTEILPFIQDVSTLRSARATGLSRTYCLDVRRARYVPHPRHWVGFVQSSPTARRDAMRISWRDCRDFVTPAS